MLGEPNFDMMPENIASYKKIVCGESGLKQS